MSERKPVKIPQHRVRAIARAARKLQRQIWALGEECEPLKDASMQCGPEIDDIVSNFYDAAGMDYGESYD